MSATFLDDDSGLEGDRLVAAFVDDVQSYAVGPAPKVGPALAEVLAGGTGVAPIPTAPAELADPAPGGFAAWLSGRRPRLALGAAIASLTFVGAGAAGALPGPAQSAFDRTADAVGLPLPETEAPRGETPAVPPPDQTASSGSDQPREHGRVGPRVTETVPPVPDAAGAAPPPAADGRGGAGAGPAVRQPGAGVPGRDTGGGSGPGAPKRVPAAGRSGPDRPGTGPEAPGPSAGRGGPPVAGERPVADRSDGAAWHRRQWSPPPPGASQSGPHDGWERQSAATSAEKTSSRPYPSTPVGR